MKSQLQCTLVRTWQSQYSIIFHIKLLSELSALRKISISFDRKLAPLMLLSGSVTSSNGEMAKLKVICHSYHKMALVLSGFESNNSGGSFRQKMEAQIQKSHLNRIQSSFLKHLVCCSGDGYVGCCHFIGKKPGFSSKKSLENDRTNSGFRKQEKLPFWVN